MLRVVGVVKFDFDFGVLALVGASFVTPSVTLKIGSLSSRASM